ncbi:UNVERIFIED_CONTAM: hypothetical protein K2H54_023739 [Gekko kuhli]
MNGGPPPGCLDHQRERDALRAELKDAQRRFAIEVRELREAAARDQQLLADRLNSRWAQRQTRELQKLREETKKHREAEIQRLLRWKQAELHESQQFLKKENNAAMRQARELQSQLAKELALRESGSRGVSGGVPNAQCQAKLPEVVGQLRWEVRHLEAELELERRLFQKYILEHFGGEPLPTGSLCRFGQASLLLEGTVNSRGAAGEDTQGGVPHPGQLPSDSDKRLKKPIAGQLNAPNALGERGTPLEESTLLRGISFPDVQEPNLRISGRPVALGLDYSNRELCDNVVAQQQAKDLSDQAGVLLAKDEQIDALQKERQELQAKLKALKERCTHLEEENGQLRKYGFPGMPEKAKILRRKCADLAALAQRLGEATKKLQELSSRLENSFSDIPEKAKIFRRKSADLAVIAQRLGEATKKLQELSSRMENSFSDMPKKAKILRCKSADLAVIAQRLGEATKKLQELSSRMENSFSDMPEKAKILRHKSADLALIAQRLGEATKKLQELSSRMENSFSDMPEKAKILRHKSADLAVLAQCLGEAAKKFQELSSRMENHPLRKISDFDLLLSQRDPSQMEHLLNPEDTTGELEGWEADGLSIHLQSNHLRAFRLRRFLARYSYDPLSSPDKNPEAELPLTAGEYVYICGEVDKDGFYVGERTDGRRGFVPSNLVEEDDDPFSFIPSEPSSISCDSVQEPSFSCQSARCDEDRGLCLLSDGPEGTSCDVLPAASDIENLALLTLWKITTTSATITWSPSYDRYTHRVYLNEKKYDVTKAGIYRYTFRNLCPSTKYSVKVEPLVPQEASVSPQGELQRKAREMTFITPSAGPPHAPIDVHVQAGSSADILVISWFPETLHPSGSSNGVKVTGYAVYINGQKVTEIMSPTAGSVSLDVSQRNVFQGPQAVTVRTISPFGESEDSVPALIPTDLWKVPRIVSSPSVVSGLTSQDVFESEGRLTPATEDTDEKRPEGSSSQ